MKVRAAIILIGVVLLLLSVAHRRRVSVEKAPRVGPARISEGKVIRGSAAPPHCTAIPEPVKLEGESTRITESAVHPALLRICRMQLPDGSWGEDTLWFDERILDPTGMTALAILSFLHQGYSHLSKDDHEGFRFGESVKRGLKWLMAIQSEDGRIRTGGDPALNHVLATLALSEAYGVSATHLFKGPAQRAVDALSEMYPRRSGWDHETTAAWAAFAISSARSSELDVPDLFVWLNQYQAATPGSRPLAAATWGLLQKDVPVSALEFAARNALEVPLDFHDLQKVLFDSVTIMRSLVFESRKENATHERWRAVHKKAREAGEREEPEGDLILFELCLLSMCEGALSGWFLR